MMVLIGIATLLILLSDFIKKKLSKNIAVLNLLICLIPLFIGPHFISPNFKFVTTGVLLLNFMGSASKAQSLLMLICLSLQRLGVGWNESILLVFLVSFFDRFPCLSGIEKLLILLGSAAIYTDVDMLAVVFVLLNSLYTKNKNLELSILTNILIFSSFDYIEMGESVSYFHNFSYLLLLSFLSSRKNILVIATSFFMVSFSYLQYEHTIAFSYTVLAMSVVVELFIYLVNLFDEEVDWVQLKPKKEDLVFIICLLGMAYKWSNPLVYIFTGIVVTIYSLDRFEKVDIRKVSTKKSMASLFVLVLTILQPWSRGFNFFGFKKILGYDLLEAGGYIPTLVLLLLFGIISFLYTRENLLQSIKKIIFKHNLKNEFRLNFITNTISSTFSREQIFKNLYPPELNEVSHSRSKVTDDRVQKFLIVLSLLFILLITIKAVAKL